MSEERAISDHIIDTYRTPFHRFYIRRSGWMTPDTFQRWFAWLRSVYDDGEPIWLMLDSHSVHQQEAMKQYASDLRIHLFFIAPGLIDEMNPLHRCVLGVVKAHGRRMYRNLVRSLVPIGKQVTAAFRSALIEPTFMSAC
jgi:DNA-binding phage protein